MSEILLRNSTLIDVDRKLRLIDLVGVPWDEEADVLWQGEMWRELFRRGSFDGLEDHAGRVRVNREHVIGDTVGKVVRFDTRSDAGLITSVKIAETDRGDETLALAAEDMISASVGYFTKLNSDVRLNRRTKLREVLRAFLHHLAMVEAPAYAGAQVLAVREEQSGPSVADVPPPETPLLDEFMNDDVFLWAASRVPR